MQTATTPKNLAIVGGEEKEGATIMDVQKTPADDQAGTKETFEALRRRIRDRFPQLSPHLQRIARASLSEPNYFALNTTSIIGASLGVQPSTLIRFSKEFGYSGFSDLQQVFRLRLIEGAEEVREKVYSDSASRPEPIDLQETIEHCVQANVDALLDMRNTVSFESMADAVQMLQSAPHIYIAGLRRSRPIATYLAYSLARSERRCGLLDFGGGMASQQIANMGPNDLLVAIGFTPYSQPVVDAVMDAFMSRRRILAITDGHDSVLAKHAANSLFVSASANARFQPISGAVCLIQALVSSLRN
jgi:DNA-binding MurR/RpiR family transcriptional regulator